MAKSTASLASLPIVAEICLYGTAQTGAGFLARAKDGGKAGDGEVKAGRSFTDAVWLAVDDLGLHWGAALVFAPGGQQYARYDLSRSTYYGDLEWMPTGA